MRRLGRRGLRSAIGVTITTTALALVLPVAGASAATAPNLVPNPSLERSSGGKPVAWQPVSTGTSTRTFSYQRGGARAGLRYVRTTVTGYGSGVAGWAFSPITVSGGATYAYSDAVRSTAASTLRVRMLDAKGATTYRTFAPTPRSASWRTAGATFSVPKGVVRLSMERVLTGNGRLDVDAARLVLRRAAPKPTTPAKPTPKPAPNPAPVPNPAPAPTTPNPAPTTPKPAPAPATGALVSITFDDGLASQYDNARPVLSANGIPATFYLISNALNTSNYMTTAQAKELQGAGNELGSHSMTHPNLTQISASQLTSELSGSKSALEAQFGTIRSLAYPYGAHNAAVEAEAAKYYQTARTTNGGLNQRGSINATALTMRYVLNDTSAATVASWMNEAANAGAWTILVYHGVTAGGDVYSVTPSQFADHMAAVKASGLRTVTVSTGYDLMT